MSALYAVRGARCAEEDLECALHIHAPIFARERSEQAHRVPRTAHSDSGGVIELMRFHG